MTNSYDSGNLSASSWYRSRVQFGGAIIFGVLVPYTVAVLINSRLSGMPVFQQSLGTSFLSTIVGCYIFRSLVAYPGIRASYYIVPVFSSVFALGFAAMLVARLEYSRPLLIASFVICILWYYVIHFMIQRQPIVRIGVVPFGDVAPLLSINGVSWFVLDDPEIPRERCTAIVADFRADMPDEWESLLADLALSDVSVLHVKQLRESLTGQVEIEHLSENSQGTLIPNGAYRTLKFCVDVAIAVMLLVPLLPVFLIVAGFIKSDTRGPVFFRQLRIGYRGVPFQVWKFRTMSHDVGPASRNAAITRDNDVRITKVGRILRRTRLDELPQLINVLLGQMSIIGPRPEAQVLSQWYEHEIPFYRYRHIVRPGITGWAQVNQGHVAEVSDVTSKLHYDFYYIANYSLWIDILIVFRTIRTILTGFGSK